MSRQVSFDLKVLVQEDGVCLFFLLWDDGSRDLVTAQTVAAKLRRDYEVWQKQYLRYYSFPVEPTMPRGGSLSLLTNEDTSAAVRNAEDAFLNTFLNWLGSGETRNIERQLQTAFTEASQADTEEASQSPGVNVFLACEDEFLKQMPWEVWARSLAPKTLAPGAIRIVRTTKNNERAIGSHQTAEALKKTRILAIIAEDEHLQIEKDWKILRSLRSVAEVERANWLPGDAPEIVTQKVFEAILDDRGWDILFFAGHSDDRINASGSFQLTPTVALSMNDIEEHLETAQRQGLRLAIFNSCSGLAIAQSLTQSGIQAIVMRERIRSDAALAFLEQFCQRLREYENAQESMLQACEVLRSTEKIKFPSAYSIPSFFSPLRTLPYRIRPFGWRQRLRKWSPTKREMVTAGVVLLLGGVPSVNDVLIEARVGLQAVYRDLTNQVPELSEGAVPPVHVIAVDQRALDMAEITEAQPIPQAFVAELIKAVAPYQPRTVGIAYLLNNPDEGSPQLIETMRTVSQEQGSWFVVPESADRNLEVFDELQQLEVSLSSDYNFFMWDVDTPDDSDLEELCPFGYLMALAHSLNADPDMGKLPDFRQTIDQAIGEQGIESTGNDFCRNVIAVKDQSLHNNSDTKNFIRKNKSFLGWQSIIDFSLPSGFFYQRTLASSLIEANQSSLPSTAQPSDQIFIIGSGDYADAEDNFSPPLALEYRWCLALNRTNIELSDQDTSQNCKFRPRSFSSSEVHAYMASHLLQQYQVRVVPNYLMTGLAIILGKSIALILQIQPQAQRKRTIKFLSFTTAGYVLLSFQLFISVPVLLPIVFPSTVFLSYLGPISRRTF